MLTRWLADEPSKLPLYASTQVGVGGCVINSKGEILMVTERVSPTAATQGMWKLPGALLS